MEENLADLNKNMAVNSAEQTNGPKSNILSAGEHEIDRKSASNLDSTVKKKSCFQITKVITNPEGDLDDELDDTAAEETSLVSFDASRNDHDETVDSNLSPHGISSSPESTARLKSSTPDGLTSSGDANLLLPNNLFENGASNKLLQPLKNFQIEQIITTQLVQVQHAKESRFKVVKIESKEPFKRGRWSCHDYLDPPTVEKSDSKPPDLHETIGSGNSSNASSVHFVPGSEDPMCDSANSDHAAALFASQNCSGGKNSTSSQAAPAQPGHHATAASISGTSAQASAQHKHVNGGVTSAHILPQQQQQQQPQLTNSNASNNPSSFASSNSSAAPATPSIAAPADVTAKSADMTAKHAQRVEGSTSTQSNVTVASSSQTQQVTVPQTGSGGHAQSYMTPAQSSATSDNSRSNVATGSAAGDAVTSNIGDFALDHGATGSGGNSAQQQQPHNDDVIFGNRHEMTLQVLGASGGTTASSSSLTPPLLEMVTQRISVSEKDDDSTNRCVQHPPPIHFSPRFPLRKIP